MNTICRILSLTFLFSLITVSRAQFPDTDGDGLLDLLDVPGFPEECFYSGFPIEDLDGVQSLTHCEELWIDGVWDDAFGYVAGDLRIRSNAFTGLDNLRLLGISAGTTEIEDYAFDGLSLDYLNLLGANLSRIDRYDFAGLSVQYIYFHNPHCHATCFRGTNEISHIDTHAFQSTDVRSIGFGPHTIFQPDVFSGVETLEGVGLNSTPELVPGVFRGLEDVELIITGAGIVDVTGVTLNGIVQFMGAPETVILDDTKFAGPTLNVSQTSGPHTLSVVGTIFTESRYPVFSNSLRKLTIDEPLLMLEPIIVQERLSRENISLTIIPQGDTNKDEKVDFIDFLTLSRNFGGEGRWSDGDFNRDEVVDFGDYLLLASNFETNVAVVPEPMSIHLLLVSILGLLQLSRARRFLG